LGLIKPEERWLMTGKRWSDIEEHWSEADKHWSDTDKEQSETDHPLSRPYLGGKCQKQGPAGFGST